jgi:hypothetical protein
MSVATAVLAGCAFLLVLLVWVTIIFAELAWALHDADKLGRQNLNRDREASSVIADKRSQDRPSAAHRDDLISSASAAFKG